MNYHPISVVSCTVAHIPQILDLALAQQARQYAQNPFLREVDLREEVEMALRADHTDGCVALDENGQVRGYAHPSVLELKPTSSLLAFLSARNGVVHHLTLPDPADRDAIAVCTELMNALGGFWRTRNTDGDLIRWPSHEHWWRAILAAYHFQLDSVCAFHPLQPFFSSRPTPLPDVLIRTARADDEGALVELFQEELLFHEIYTPFVHSSPQVLETFRSKLGRLWTGGRLEEGGPLVLVAEQAGSIIAMVENSLVSITPNAEPGFTPPGDYWCIDNMSVREEHQRQGIGRLLVQAIEDVLLSLSLDVRGYLLWFNPDNPSAACFWPRLGFRSLWTTYQRRSLMNNL